MYAVLFAIAYGVARARGADNVAAWAVALACVIVRVATRYTGAGSAAPWRDVAAPWRDVAMPWLDAALVLAVAVAAGSLRSSRAVRYALFAGLLWLSGTCAEYALHKYVMHCTQNAPWLKRSRTLRETCESHHDHHLSVKPDNTLSHVHHAGELVFDWSVTLKVLCVVAPVMVAWDAALGLGVGARAAFVATAVAMLGFSAVWNSVHPDMHGYEGPFPRMPPRVPGLRARGVLARNHELHHQVKGPRKGNYNVVFLGADELFGANRMTT